MIRVSGYYIGVSLNVCILARKTVTRRGNIRYDTFYYYFTVRISRIYTSGINATVQISYLIFSR